MNTNNNVTCDINIIPETFETARQCLGRANMLLDSMMTTSNMDKSFLDRLGTTEFNTFDTKQKWVKGCANMYHRISFVEAVLCEMDQEQAVLFNKYSSMDLASLYLSVLGEVEKTDKTNNMYTQVGELSAQRCSEIAAALRVTPEYVAGLHLPADWKIGDSVLPAGVTPSKMKYSDGSGNPILAEGFGSLADGHTATTYNGKVTRGAFEGGQTVNFASMGYFAPDEFNGDYFTWYGPVCNQGAIAHTSERFYTCDDSFYRDKDGYIVCASDPFKNYLVGVSGWGGVRVDNGGLSEEDRIVATPFGLARMYDNCGLPSMTSRKYCEHHIDIYRNDGYERYREDLTGDYEEVIGPVVYEL